MLLLSGCNGGGAESDVDVGVDGDVAGIVGVAGDYIVLAWNDLGMHCLNPTYDQAVILPPYNTVWAQVIRRGNPPAPVTSNLTVEYRVVNNTSSTNKRSFGQFWTYVVELFGVNLVVDTGLNFADPNRHNGLAGTMVAAGDHFEVHGIPVTPVDDALAWNPYQVIELTLKNDGGEVPAVTRATLPTSDEINCGKCHNTNADPFVDIIETHDTNEGSSLAGQGPVLCAECHGSPHAMVPSRQAADNYQAIQYQGSPKTIGSCGACHGASKGEGGGEFLEEHGSGGRNSACNVCHLGINSNNTALWPHQFQWQNR